MTEGPVSAIWVFLNPKSDFSESGLNHLCRLVPAHKTLPGAAGCLLHSAAVSRTKSSYRLGAWPISEVRVATSALLGAKPRSWYPREHKAEVLSEASREDLTDLLFERFHRKVCVANLLVLKPDPKWPRHRVRLVDPVRRGYKSSHCARRWLTKLQRHWRYLEHQLQRFQLCQSELDRDQPQSAQV